MRPPLKSLKIVLLLIVLLVVLASTLVLGGIAFVRHRYEPQLPDISEVTRYRMQVPLRVYSADGKLIGEFGAARREILSARELPPRVVQAFLAAEDDRFYSHPGVDWQGLLRAALELARTGQKSQGGSTITMQLARNLFLTPERSYERKIKEILLSLQIERELGKDRILELYLNQIFLGQRAYGVSAAAQVYFNRSAADLSWSQAALLAGLPKAPSRDNPIAAPQRAKQRRDYVLRRLQTLGWIDQATYEQALAEPIVIQQAVVNLDADARYVAEMVRADMVARFGDAAYVDGFDVVTRIDSRLQDAANAALRNALHEYDERQGWRGAELQLDPTLWGPAADPAGPLAATLGGLPSSHLLPPAVVLQWQDKVLRLRTAQGEVNLPEEAYRWARVDAKTLLPGAVVRLRTLDGAFRLAQLPEAQGALVALDPQDGGIVALAGGYDFQSNKFNRVTQALRQPGSGFKPLLYCAAFNFGFTPASVVLDAPVVVDDPSQPEAWRPKNYSGDIQGPMRLREALVQSRNLVSIRLLQSIGVDYGREFAQRFGLPAERIPQNLTMALGTGVFTPLEMARAYAVIANGGFLINPWYIASIRNGEGRETALDPAPRACRDCAEATAVVNLQAAGSVPSPILTAVDGRSVALAPRVVDGGVTWMVNDVLRDVVSRGTATRAKALKRSDLAGKTGTTNDETDAWFFGFTPALVGVAWVGFDQPTPLGRGEVGGRAALPMWVDFMRTALEGVPEQELPMPDGLVRVRVDASSGQLAGPGSEQVIFEVVPAARLPAVQEQAPVINQTQLQDIF